MKTFNAFQAVLMFSGWPLLLQWLYSKPFGTAMAVFFPALIAYVIGFIVMIGCVLDSMD